MRFVRSTEPFPASSFVHSEPSTSASCDTSIAEGEEVQKFYEDLISSRNNIVAINTEKAKEYNKRAGGVSSKEIKKKCRSNISENPTVSTNGIMKLAMDGDLPSLSRFVSLGKADLNVCDDYGWTPLMCASAAGKIHMVKYLLQNGGNPDILDKSGRRAIDYALMNNHGDIVEIIRQSYRKFEATPVASQQTAAHKECFCDFCKVRYTDDAHCTSTLHLFNTRKPIHTIGYSIPEWNKGYRILKGTGWNEMEGLGKECHGRRYPIKTVFKNDRQGIGLSAEAPKVTHFGANDERAVQSSNNIRVRRRIGNARSSYEEDKLKEKIIRQMFRD
ncbi:hypothetical protein AB6A40_001277 [Gnathostoma spinigerum]|uniref:G-patch domain-containing protein n=1 Tax=Gnathostoma spinigerum TaxID=75299 RepID=A0ABD6E3Y8_9BILA